MFTSSFPLPGGFAWQYHLLLWIQSFQTPWLDKLAIKISFLGTESLYLFVLPILFLAVSRKNGMRLAYIFLTSMFFNAWLKTVISVARPIGVPGVTSGYISSATGLSMPSGHAQGTMTFFVGVSKWVRRRWILWLGIVLVFLIGLSRVYLGLHWPFDVVVGWILGLLIGLIGWDLGRYWSYRQVPFRLALVIAVLFPAVLFYFSQDAVSAEYATFMFSLGTGAAIEKQFIHSQIDGRWWKRICVAVICVGGLIAIQWGMKQHLEELPWRLFRDLLIGWWTTLGAPWLFLKIDLYRTEDTPTRE